MKVMKSIAIAALSVLGLLAVSTDASAEETGNVFTMKPITVYGNPNRPSVVIEVSRARMQLGATTPTLNNASKITDASKKDPF